MAIPKSKSNSAFRLVGGSKVYHDLEEKDGLYVRKGFNPDLSLVKEWNSVFKKVEPLLSGANILDIGANIGIFSRFALKRFRAESCVCLEPEPGAFSVLKHNVSGRNCTLINNAVGAVAKKCDLSLPASGNSISASTVFSKKRRQLVSVDCLPFLEVVSKFKPTLIKSDCEGAELEFLDGTKLPRFVKTVTAELHRELPGQEEMCLKCIDSFRDWSQVHPPKSYSFHRCWIVTWTRP